MLSHYGTTWGRNPTCHYTTSNYNKIHKSSKCPHCVTETTHSQQKLNFGKQRFWQGIFLVSFEPNN